MNPTSHSSLALCMTVKNEVKLLARNLSYHRAAGVSAFYIFDDSSTDATLDSVKQFPDVHVFPSVDFVDYLQHPQLGPIAARAGDLITARQVLNAHIALQHARLAGHEWMISLDADELLLPNDSLEIAGSLQRYFDSIPPEIEAVRFLTAELIPTHIHSEHPFRDCRYFRTQLRRNIRNIQDPFAGKSITINSFIGHAIGKSAARTRRDIVHQSVHRFSTFAHGELAEHVTRWLLHYNIYSFDNFVEKYRRFRNLPDTWLKGQPIEHPRALWIKLTNDPTISEASLLDYYHQNLLEKAESLGGKQDVHRLDRVARFFTQLG